MSLSFGRTFITVFFLTATLAGGAKASGGFAHGSNGFGGCEPDCSQTDAAIRYMSQDPTDPSKFGATVSGLGVRTKIGTLLDNAQQFDAVHDFENALGAAQKAREASYTDYEKLKSDQVLLEIHTDMHNDADATVDAEDAADLTYIPSFEKADVFTNACILATNAKHFDKAARYAKAMQALNLTDARSQRIIDHALQSNKESAIH
jgi:hypothetical protein